MATLIRNVCVDREWWGPAWGNADQVPAKVARRITNPAAWDTPDLYPGVPTYAEAARVTVPDLDRLTRQQLVDLARARNIQVNPRGRVADLREIIAEASR